MRLCSGHPKVHFRTIVEGSWEGRGCSVGPPGSLTGVCFAFFFGGGGCCGGGGRGETLHKE